MRKHKKIIIIALVALLVIGGTLGAVAFVQADNPTTTTTATSTNTTSLWDRIAAILKQNNNVNISGTDLQNAANQARQQMDDERLDNMLNKLVADGKITQKQADDYKAWLQARPSTMISDQYKQWLQSKPQGIPFGSGMPRMPRMGGFGKMFGR
jgi:ABC-type glycerol-3-phosphate transport system substrate-binding protein